MPFQGIIVSLLGIHPSLALTCISASDGLEGDILMGNPVF